MEQLLADASAWCVGQIPGTLIDDDGALVLLADLPAPIVPLLVQVCAALVEHWLTPVKNRNMRCEQMAAASLLRLTKLLALCDDNAMERVC